MAKRTSTLNRIPNGEDENSIKSRILNSLNANHGRSLSIYLQHYCALSPAAAAAAAAAAPRLSAITLESLTIATADGTEYTIAITPALKSWAEASERVAEMERRARESVDGTREVKGDGEHVARISYVGPRAPGHIFMIFVIIFFAGSVWAGDQGKLVPGHWYYEHVMWYFPGGPEWYLRTQEQLWWPAVGLHAAEAVGMMVRLWRKGISCWQGVWWAWVGSTFLEGWGAHARFGEAIRRRRVTRA